VAQWSRGQTRVAWVHGAVVVDHRGQVVLIDAPEGVGRALDAGVLSRVHAVCLSSGVLRDLAGLLVLLEQRSRLAAPPATVVFPLGEERPAALLDAWSRGWAQVAPVVQDAVHPGATLTLGGVEVDAVPLGRGEVRWRPQPHVVPTVGLGWRIRTEDATVAVGRLPVPDGAVEKLVRGADLAIIEVGVEPWPVEDRRWRLRPDEAARVSGAGDLWLVGDDGRFGAGPDQ